MKRKDSVRQAGLPTNSVDRDGHRHKKKTRRGLVRPRDIEEEDGEPLERTMMAVAPEPEPDSEGAKEEEEEEEEEGAKLAAAQATSRRRVNHRLNKALLERAHLVERELLPSVDLHYVIDRRLDETDIEWKLRSAAIGLVVQFPGGIDEAQRRQLLEEVKRRVCSLSKEKKRRTCLSVLKKVGHPAGDEAKACVGWKANLVEIRAKFGRMRYASVQAMDGHHYLVLANLPNHKRVADKLAELRSRIDPLLVHFHVKLNDFKEIAIQSLRGRIFTNKDAIKPGDAISARIDLRVRQFTNLEKPRSDRGLVITLIHELAHAITPSDLKQIKGGGRVKVSHGPLFWDNVMKIAKLASLTEDPTIRTEDGQVQEQPWKVKRRAIFEMKDEAEFRNKIEQEDSLLTDELVDDEEDVEPDLPPQPSFLTPLQSWS